METMPFFSRFCGSVIDKIIIIVVFVFTIILCYPFQGGDYLGMFEVIIRLSPNSYSYMPNPDVYISTDKLMSEVFIIVNLLYYAICEQVFKASLGKLILGGFLVNVNKERVNEHNVFRRTICLAALMIVDVIVMHILLGASYFITAILFFLILDIPVFFYRQSLVDLDSGTMYVKNIKKND